jgi:hypothetical protein
MESTTTRRLPLRRARRVRLNVTVAPETRIHLERIGDGNRSAAIEELVRLYRARELTPQPTT